MSNSSLSSSPARSSISTTAIVGANAHSALAADDFNVPADLMSVHDRKDEALLVLKSDLMAALNKEVKSLDEDSWMFEGPRSRINLISRPVLKSDLMAALNKEVKSLDEDSWMFEGPRSRINLISRPGGLLLHKRAETTKHRNLASQK